MSKHLLLKNDGSDLVSMCSFKKSGLSLSDDYPKVSGLKQSFLDIEKSHDRAIDTPAEEGITLLVVSLTQSNIDLKNGDAVSSVLRCVPYKWLFHAAQIGLEETKKKMGSQSLRDPTPAMSETTKATEADVAKVVAQATSGKVATTGLTTTSIAQLQESFDKIEKALLGGHEHARRMELALRTWRTEKMQLKSTIEEIKFQLQYFQSKAKVGSGRHADDVKSKKKIAELSKQLFKMKLEALQIEFKDSKKKIEDTIKELKEFQSHTGPKMCLQACLNAWEKAYAHLNNQYYALKSELELALGSKEVPDVNDLLPKSLIIDFPDEPDYVKLWEDCQREASSEKNSYDSSRKPSSKASKPSRSSTTAPRAPSSNTKVTQIVEQIMLLQLVNCDEYTILTEVETYRDSEGSAKFDRMDADDIVSDIVLRLTQVGRSGTAATADEKTEGRRGGFEEALSVEDECTICKDPLRQRGRKVKRLECGHRFHEDCNAKWFRIHKSCAYCRHQSVHNEDYPSLQ